MNVWKERFCGTNCFYRLVKGILFQAVKQEFKKFSGGFGRGFFTVRASHLCLGQFNARDFKTDERVVVRVQVFFEHVTNAFVFADVDTCQSRGRHVAGEFKIVKFGRNVV